MKKIIRYIIRKIFCVRSNETILDAINRKKYFFLKKINKNHFSIEDFEKVLISLGLKKGDTVIVHCAWRSFIGFDGSPQDVIDCIKKIVGNSGNILMPAFTGNTELFRYNDKSNAGVLSETFRNNINVKRSINSVFSMCSYGKKSSYYLDDHINSVYCFDNNSPYFKAIQDNSKVLLLGLGKKPHKITIFHCVSYSLRNKIKCYNNVYTLERIVTLYDDNNKKIEKVIIDRVLKCQNSKRKFKYLFKKNISKSQYRQLNFLDIYLFDSKKMYNAAYDYMLKNKYNIYK